MATGVIQSYDNEKKFGYIKLTGRNDDLFFHHSDLDEPVEVGDEVEFDITEGTHSLQAVYIHKKA